MRIFKYNQNRFQRGLILLFLAFFLSGVNLATCFGCVLQPCQTMRQPQAHSCCAQETGFQLKNTTQCCCQEQTPAFYLDKRHLLNNETAKLPLLELMTIDFQPSFTLLSQQRQFKLLYTSPSPQVTPVYLANSILII